MAISYIGSAAAAGSSVTLPTHQTGDLIVIVAFGNTTGPTLPGGWTDGGANTGSSQSTQVGYKIAASSSEVSDTWSSATGVVAHVYRGAATTRRRGYTSGNGTTIGYPALSTMINDGTSWVALFARHQNTGSDVQSPPAGVTLRANITGSGSEYASFDTNGGVSSWSLTNQTVSPAAAYSALSLEITAATATVYTLTVDTAAVTLTGSSVSLKRALKLTVNSASITVAGSSVSVKKQFLPFLVSTSSIALSGSNVTITGPPRIQYVGSSINTGSSITSMPTHQAGDLLLITAFRNNNTSAITLPAEFTSVVAGVVGSGSYGLVGYKIAASSGEVSGTWTGATLIQVQVYRNVKQSDPIGASASNANTTSTISYPSITLEVSTYRSWVVTVAAHAAADHAQIGTAPSGSINRTALNGGSGSMAANDTGTGVPSFAGGSPSTGGAAGDWFASSIEILYEAPIQRLTVDTAAITLTGSSVTLRKSNILTVSPAGVTVTGQNVTIGFIRTLTVTAASITLSGDSVNVTVTRKLTVTAASITLNGDSVNVTVTRKLTVTAASITLSGDSVNLFKGFFHSLTVTAASITLSGDSVNVTVTRKLTVTAASITLSGDSVGFNKSQIVTVLPASITLSGDSVNMTVTLSPGSVIMKYYDGTEFFSGVLKRYSSTGVWSVVNISSL